MNQLTLVTAYYNLSKIDGSISKPQEKYFDLADYVFKLDCNIVFFIEQESYMKIWTARKKYNLLDKTLIIIKPLSDLKYFDKYDEANKLVNQTVLAMQDRNKHTTSYLLFMYNKVELLDEVIGMNPFCSQTFGWIDFGIDYITKGFELNEILNKPSIKVKICEVVHIPKQLILDNEFEAIATQYVARTVGGFWMGNIIMMKLFIDKCRQWINKLLKHNFVTYDENIYEIILQLHPEITEKYYGRYWYFFDNWTVHQHYDEWFLNNLKSCREHNEHDQVVDMYQKLLVYQWDFMSNSDKFDVYFEVIISSFYVDRNLYFDCCKNFVDLIQDNLTDVDMMMKLYASKDIVIQNLSFANKDFDLIIESILENNS